MKHSSRAVLIKYIPTIICSLTFTSSTLAAMNVAAELFKIIPHNDQEQVQKCLALNTIDINRILFFPGTSYTGTALQYACVLNTQNNYLRVIEIFLNRPNINVKKESPDFPPALHIAAQNGQLKLARLILIKQPNSYKFRDKSGKTALHHATAQNHKKMMQLLIFRGSDVNARTQQGRTPLHFAAQNPWYNPIKCLIDKKADTTVRDNNNTTPFETFVAHIQKTYFRDEIINSFLQATSQRIPYGAFKKALEESHSCPKEIINLILQLYYRITEEKILEIAKRNGIHHDFIKDLCHPKYVDLI